MTYDLVVWPVDRALSLDEALSEVERVSHGVAIGLGHDRRLDRFIGEMEKRYPGILGQAAEPPPCEFDVHRRHVFIGISWSDVEELVAVVAEAAWRTGTAVYDPQRETVGLPAPFAPAPLTVDGVEPHVRRADEAFAAIGRGAARADGGDDDEVQRAIAEELGAAGFVTTGPLGVDATPQVVPDAAEDVPAVAADQNRVPAALQTPELRDQLIAALGSPDAGTRHAAVTQLAGWDHDPEVAAALRPVLALDDVYAACLAATGLARQGDVTDLPAMVSLVYRMSPADGGTLESMLSALPPALDLAAVAGPVALDGLKARARLWRGDPSGREHPWELDARTRMDELLDRP